VSPAEAAVENVLNFERARKAEREARRQSDRLSTVLRINNAVVAHLDLHELLRAISGCLRELVGHDTTSVALYDAESGKLRVVRLPAGNRRRGGGANQSLPKPVYRVADFHCGDFPGTGLSVQTRL
jgi:transcriptional regulator with GAF, ATPase, and Fis domain